MSSVDPNRPNPATPKFFTACDNVVNFYKKLNVTSRETVGPLGGKSFVWFVPEDEQPFQIRCTSNVETLGYGVLSIESKISSNAPIKRWMSQSTVVDPDTATFKVKGPLGLFKHEIRLPKPNHRKPSTTPNSSSSSSAIPPGF